MDRREGMRMPDCHKCPVEATKDKLCISCREAMCIKCKGPSETPHNDGQCFVDIDSVQVAEMIEGLTERDRADLLEVMGIWLRLPQTARDALAFKMINHGLSDAEISRRIGISRAGVGIAVKRAGDAIVAGAKQLTIGL